MTFEEFFKKKKISLPALEQGEPGLFSEFKTHFEKMGEKSFDHTKKYWFNKLRLRFPAPPEPKAEKMVIENPLAEQTINETLSETPPSPSAPAAGFKPRFRAGMTRATASEAEAKPEAETPTENTEAPPPAPPAAVGFKPRFKAGITKPAESTANTERTAEPEKPAEDKPSDSAVGFKPRFKAGLTKPANPSAGQNEEPKNDE